MKVCDLFEEWNHDNDPIKDEDVLRRLRRKIRACDEEIQLLQSQLRDWDGFIPGEEKNISPEQKFRIQKKINSLQTYRISLDEKRLAALKKFKIFQHDPEASYRYAVSVRKGPFPEGEAAIAKNGTYAIQYALDVIHKRFPQGEEAMRDISVSPALKARYLGTFGVNLHDYTTHGYH